MPETNPVPSQSTLHDERLTTLQQVHKLTPLMADILAALNEHGPLSGEALSDCLRVRKQGVGAALGGLQDRCLVAVIEYHPGSGSIWKAST